jgi:hypothetical protein
MTLSTSLDDGDDDEEERDEQFPKLTIDNNATPYNNFICDKE